MPEVLCDACDIPEGKSKNFTLTRCDSPFEFFVINFHGQFYAYENHCPHTGINLNWQADQFLDITEQRIQCSTHGALFRITDGLCEWGPCVGKSLRPLIVKNMDGQLILTNEATQP